MTDIKLDYTNVLAGQVGKKHGLTLEQITELSPAARDIHKGLQAKRKSGALPFYDLPYDKESTTAIVKASRSLRKKFSTMVVLGIGGSALGTMALFSALRRSQHNSLTVTKREGMRLYVADNIDPDHFAELLSTIKIKETVFNVISKSGATAETMSQFMIVANLLKKKIGKTWKRHIIFTTDPESGVLREISKKEKIKTFEVPPGVGGRFTVFTPVSLLPAACAGIDIRKLLNGAATMAERTNEPDLMKNPAYLFSAIHYLLDTKKGKKITVMMPYSSGLYLIADWFRQMWAESLGKRTGDDGAQIFVGQTPVKALGATDQHSQVQLYVEGPFDKVVVFLDVANFATKTDIPKGFADSPAVSYLGGRTLNELMAVEKEGTEYALTVNNRPNMTIKLPEISPETVGQILYLLQVATAFSGGLYKINAFDQPGVEFGKQYAYAMMDREGFEDQKAEFAGKQPKERSVV